MEKITIRVGETLPELELTEGSPLTRVNVTDLCRNKKVIIFGVLGAFTPGCSTIHLRGFVSKSSELRKRGYHEIICITVNDVFVTEAWAKELRAEGKVRVLADPDAEFVKALGLDTSIPTLCGARSKRFIMVVANNIVKQLTIEPETISLSCTLTENPFF